MRCLVHTTQLGSLSAASLRDSLWYQPGWGQLCRQPCPWCPMQNPWLLCSPPLFLPSLTTSVQWHNYPPRCPSQNKGGIMNSLPSSLLISIVTSRPWWSSDSSVSTTGIWARPPSPLSELLFCPQTILRPAAGLTMSLSCLKPFSWLLVPFGMHSNSFPWF